MVMFGADVDVLRATALRFVETSRVLRVRRAELTGALGSTVWSGPDAARARAEWQRVGAPALATTSAFMEALGRRLLDHAGAQAQASTAPAGDAPTGSLTPVDVLAERAAASVRDLGDDVREAIDGLVDAVFGGVFADRARGDHPVSPTSGPGGDPGVSLTGLRPMPFVAVGDGRAGLVAAMTGFADEGRIQPDEIEIRALDNGRFVVVLPGVTDLSRGAGQFVDTLLQHGPIGLPGAVMNTHDAWADNDEPTVRKMRYAYEAALRDDVTTNEYAVVAMRAMEAAGVPAGAEVMIVGHSFGAYTAVDLAADPEFNSADRIDPGAGYHVRITHVVAVGAETDWRLDEIPGDTSVLLLNNRWDAVYQAEDRLHPNGSSMGAGQLEKVFWGGRAGYGHDEHNYIDWVRDATDHGDLADWLAGVGGRYSAGGVRISAKVPDPNP